ncbi:hypothetical protein BD310DRAFT_937692 [Dichomitus squalens]|uniref:Uncharacterized protein n=1 Tax=Dichomitus squalens TaxID=114155 RepID=A0A4Q9PFL1_9APHY|nr:hypothetical protein BD310DRAFT_937692 [Dichomitus squalens]
MATLHSVLVSAGSPGEAVDLGNRVQACDAPFHTRHHWATRHDLVFGCALVVSARELCISSRARVSRSAVV